jgi:hypothetical protein
MDKAGQRVAHVTHTLERLGVTDGRCRQCDRYYYLYEYAETMEAMYGTMIDEDYVVMVDGLCPQCWPEPY